MDICTDGHCLCGAVRFRFSGPVNWTGYCHCESCRRNCAAPVTAFFGVPDDSFEWTGEAPAEFSVSDHATRSFCAACGTPMAYASTRFPDETHFYAATLSDPAAFTPKQHFHHEEALPWIRIDDTLVRHAATALKDALK